MDLPNRYLTECLKLSLSYSPASLPPPALIPSPPSSSSSSISSSTPPNNKSNLVTDFFPSTAVQYLLTNEVKESDLLLFGGELLIFHFHLSPPNFDFVEQKVIITSSVSSVPLSLPETQLDSGNKFDNF
ncbi:hypothetical protein LINPERHAP2_LOCUS19102 [Linum perenne]